jgi:hypothetical protein
LEEFGPRGAVVAMLGRTALHRGETNDAVSLEPLYIRPSEAERQFG